MPETVAIIVMNRDRPDITDQVVEQVKDMGEGLDTSLFVVEAGSHPEKRSRYATHYFRDPGYKGRYYAFNQGLKFAHQEKSAYDYYWFVVNDITFPQGQDTLKLLWEAMQEAPNMAEIGPEEPEAKDYKGCHPKSGRRWHKVSTIHGLAMLVRGTAYRQVGYCSPKFHYAQGASTEFAYKMYKAGWFLAYSDIAHLYHDQSGSTYGVVTKISRHEYNRRARDFAAKYFRKHYGENWDQLFTSVLPDDVEDNTFPWQREVWERKMKRNWREFYPWFWKTGSQIKNVLRKMGILKSSTA
ncbi:MAG: glycosyltransferase family 2 protein [Halothece sp.]